MNKDNTEITLKYQNSRTNRIKKIKSFDWKRIVLICIELILKLNGCEEVSLKQD